MQTDKPDSHDTARAADGSRKDAPVLPEQRFMAPTPRNGTPPLPAALAAAVAAVPEGSVTTIPLSLIAPPSHDVKPDRTQDDIRQKLESIQQHGVLEPVLGFWRADGMFELLDGLTRYLALLMGGFKEAPVRDLGHIPTPAEALEIQMTCNLVHAQMSDRQIADAIIRHRKLTGGTQTAACLAFGIKPPRGSKAMAIFTKLPPEVREMVESGDLKSRAGYALSKLSDIPTIIDLAKKAVSLPMDVESVEEAVNKLLGNRKAKEKAFKFSCCGVTGVIKKSNPLEVLKALQALGAKATEVGKMVERNPALIDAIGSLLKGG